VAESDFEVVVAGEFQKSGIVLNLRFPFQHHRGEIVVTDGVRDPSKGGEGHQMTLDKKLKATSGKEVSKEISGVAEEKDEAVESSKLGMMDHRPITLPFFSWEEAERMIDLGHLLTKFSSIGDHCRITYPYPLSLSHL